MRDPRQQKVDIVEKWNLGQMRRGKVSIGRMRDPPLLKSGSRLLKSGDGAVLTQLGRLGGFGMYIVNNKGAKAAQARL